MKSVIPFSPIQNIGMPFLFIFKFFSYILSFCVSDFTGQMWLQSFNEQGAKLLGVTANELYNLKVFILL